MTAASDTQAQRAAAFTASIGVNQHIGYGGTVYANVPLTQQELAYLGVNLVRDQAPNAATLSSYQQLAAAGVKFDLITSPADQDLSNTLPSDIAEIAALAQSALGSVLSVECPNELNGGQWVSLNGASSQIASVGAAIVQDVSAAVRASATLAAQAVKVVNVSINNGGAGWQNYVASLGNLSAYVNNANWHIYFNNGSQPGPVVASMYKDAQTSAPGQPVLFTEAGYTTAVGASGVGVDQATQAKNTLNLLADAYKAGVQQTFLYELMDGVANPSATDTEDNFGLFTAGGAPKQVATAIHNLTTILADPASGAQTFATGSLNYSISNLPSTGNSLLLEKASGAFDLMVWNEAQDWNAGSQSAISVAPTTAVVSLGATYGTVEVFDPLQGATPIQTLNNVSSVSLGLTDHPLIIEVEPAAGAGGFGAAAPANGGNATGGPTAAATSTTSGAPAGSGSAAASPDGTIVTTVGGSIIDGSGNSWTLSPSATVLQNGQPAGFSMVVKELAYAGGHVWQENAANLWWQWNGITWTGGTSTGPLPSSQQIVITDAATSIATSVDASAAGSQSADGSTVSIASPGFASLALGVNASRLQFIHMSSVTVTGGSGASTITQDTGTGTFMPGSGAMDVTGGSGAHTYVVRPGDGSLTIEDFSAAKGDTLSIDPSLWRFSSFTSDGDGGRLLSFGTAAGSVDLKHVTSLPFQAIRL